MMRGLVAGLVAAPLVLAGCAGDGGKTEDLREFLRQAHEFDSGYDGLGEVTYSDGNVTVDTDAWADPHYGAYLYCDWVSGWLYDGDNGTADSRVVVVMDGETVLTRRGLSESCDDASFEAQYGG